MFINIIINYARLTNQQEETIQFMRLTQYPDQGNIPEFLRNIPGLTWCSRFFNYQLKMLEDLSPNGAAVSQHPYNNLPPPHLLIGYAYLFNVNNNYNFSTRNYSRIKYSRHIDQWGKPRNFWNLLSDCSYTLDMRAIATLPATIFEESFTNLQNEILLNRIVADMNARTEFEGRGISLQPEARENVYRQQLLNNSQTFNLDNYFSFPHFAYLLRLNYETEKDARTLSFMNTLIKVITNFIYFWLHSEEKEYLPFNENWISTLLESYNNWKSEKNNRYIKSFIAALNTNQPFSSWKNEIFGGARLRSGTRTDLPFLLRQRENQRAITENMRRNRGQIVERFIDSLPLIRRIRRTPQIPPPEEEEDAGEGPSGLQRQEEEENLGTEMLRILHLILNELRRELSEPAREHEIFNFGTEFYNTFAQFNRENRIDENFIRRFFFYFFLMEHISSTLFYYHSLLHLNVLFRRYTTFNYIQVIITGRDENGRVNLHRVWHNNNISPFIRIYRTILRDVLHIVKRSGEDIDAFQEEELLTALEHRPESGDPNDILQQAKLKEENISSLTVSYKLNPLGLVTTSTNRSITANASNVRSQEMRRLRSHQS
ncbi:pTP [Psittacine adenovirus 2]|uniref:PTP n=1 Tax=Psittacine adenovirus 2 TaxID=1301246 RepID=A0ABX8SNC5_9ADEN|nr:pTP [Psittacine adenovirus 2]